MRRACLLFLIAMFINLFGLGLKSPQPAYAAQIRYAIPTNGLTSGSCDSWEAACTLTQAIASAVSGDQIWVASGTYVPTTDTNRKTRFTLKAGVAIYGGFLGNESSLDDRDWANHVTTLSGDIGTVGVNTDNSYNVVYSTGLTSSAVLDGFTITGGYASLDASPPYNCGGGISNNNSSPTLNNLVLTG